MTTLNIYNFLNKRTMLHSKKVLTFYEGIAFFIDNQHNFDIITYNHTDIFSLFNVAFLKKDADGNYFYEYRFEKHSDIIDNICITSPDIKFNITYNISGIYYRPEELTKFISVSAPYSDFKVIITFLSKPSPETVFIIEFRNYLINTDDRRLLAKSHVETANNIYVSGVCIKKDTKTKCTAFLQSRI